MAAGIIIVNIDASITLLIVLCKLSETIDRDERDTDVVFDKKVLFFYILIFIGFYIAPLTV